MHAVKHFLKAFSRLAEQDNVVCKCKVTQILSITTHWPDLSQSIFLNTSSRCAVMVSHRFVLLPLWSETFRSSRGRFSCLYIPCICPPRVLCKSALFPSLSIASSTVVASINSNFFVVVVYKFRANGFIILCGFFSCLIDDMDIMLLSIFL